MLSIKNTELNSNYKTMLTIKNTVLDSNVFPTQRNNDINTQR